VNPREISENDGADACLVEAALHLTGLCDRFELAEMLGWSLTRLERALGHLGTRLDGSAVCLVRLGREVRLAVREGAAPPDTLACLTQRGQMRTELTAAEAARVLDLIRERLTDPHASPRADTAAADDVELLERGVLVPDAMTEAAGPSLAAHPDVYFALGLCPMPVAAAVPHRPDPPSLPSAGDPWARSADGRHVAIPLDDQGAG